MRPDRPLVAVLDDDAEFAEVLALLLEEEGIASDRPAVERGTDLADVLAGGPYDLAIVDVHGVAGDDLGIIERLRADERLAEMPILVCSADIQLLRDHASLLSSLPGVLALEKPFRLEVLSGALERLLAGTSAPPAPIHTPPDPGLLAELEAWLGGVGERVHWPALDVWIADARPGFLRCVATWVGSPRFEPFAAVSRRTHLPIGGGMPGRVWASGRAGWIDDLASDMNFPRLSTAHRVGLLSAAAAPVIDGESTIGVISAYTNLRRRHDANIPAELEASGREALHLLRRLAAG